MATKKTTKERARSAPVPNEMRDRKMVTLTLAGETISGLDVLKRPAEGRGSRDGFESASAVIDRLVSDEVKRKRKRDG